MAVSLHWPAGFAAMALSHHGKVAVISLAALLVLLFAGAAQAWTCAPGQKDCSGCINPLEDVNNCGKCKNKCQPCVNGVPTCTNGMCGLSCNPGYQNCDSRWDNGCETDVNNNVLNCGGCGGKCVAPPKATVSKCNKGTCEYVCIPGYANCDNDWTNGCERYTPADLENCGACGTKCLAPPKSVATCNNNTCEYVCTPGYANCDDDWTNGCERSTDTDVEHCGKCNTKCPKPMYFGGAAKCTLGKCETQSCVPGMKYDAQKKCCKKGGGDDGGEKDDDDDDEDKEGDEDDDDEDDKKKKDKDDDDKKKKDKDHDDKKKKDKDHDDKKKDKDHDDKKEDKEKDKKKDDDEKEKEGDKDGNDDKKKKKDDKHGKDEDEKDGH